MFIKDENNNMDKGKKRSREGRKKGLYNKQRQILNNGK